MGRRLGTAAGLALSAAVAAEAFGLRAFNRLVRADVQALLPRASAGETKLVTEDLLDGLPEPVQRYLTYAGVVGKPFVRAVYLRQGGRMCLGSRQPWLPLAAQQWYSVQPPGFVWDATIHVGPLPLVRARDMYRSGKGQLLVKAASLLTVVNAKGEAMDQGEMVRYLSEMIWFPSAFLEQNVAFEAADATSAHVTLTDHGRTVTGTMSFDSEGRLTEFAAPRIFDETRGLETWSVPITGYDEFEGLRLPSRGKAVWKLAEGDQEYIQVVITKLEHQV